MHFSFQWFWTWPNDLGSKSWHTHRSLAIFVWNKNLQCSLIRKIWPNMITQTDEQTDGETDGQGDSYIVNTPKLCKGGIIIIFRYITELFWSDVSLLQKSLCKQPGNIMKRIKYIGLYLRQKERLIGSCTGIWLENILCKVR